MYRARYLLVVFVSLLPRSSGRATITRRSSVPGTIDRRTSVALTIAGAVPARTCLPLLSSRTGCQAPYRPFCADSRLSLRLRHCESVRTNQRFVDHVKNDIHCAYGSWATTPRGQASRVVAWRDQDAAVQSVGAVGSGPCTAPPSKGRAAGNAAIAPDAVCGPRLS